MDYSLQPVGQKMVKIQYPFLDLLNRPWDVINRDSDKSSLLGLLSTKLLNIVLNNEISNSKDSLVNTIKREYKKNPIQDVYLAYPNLPEVVVTPNNTKMFAVLDTYAPLVNKKYIPGHSVLHTPMGKEISQYDKDLIGYGLFGYNCSKATLSALLRAIHDKNEKNFISVTPGDTRDYAKKRFGATDLNKTALYKMASDYSNNKNYQTLIPKTKVYSTDDPTWQTYIPLTPLQARSLDDNASFRNYLNQKSLEGNNKVYNKYRLIMRDYEDNIDSPSVKNAWEGFRKLNTLKRRLERDDYSKELNYNLRYF